MNDVVSIRRSATEPAYLIIHEDLHHFNTIRHDAANSVADAAKRIEAIRRVETENQRDKERYR